MVDPKEILAPERTERGAQHPTIAITPENLATCIKHCGSCASYPGRDSEALFCATGRSDGPVEARGCNCFDCPLFERCGTGSRGFFCARGEARVELRSQDDYLQRFLPADERVELDPSEAGPDASTLQLQFEDERVISASSDRSILQCAIDAGVPMTHVCGGRALCSTCRVLILDGVDNVLPRTEREQRLAAAKGFSPEVRLACQTRARGPVRLKRLVLDAEDIDIAIDQGQVGAGAVGKDAQVAVLFSDIRAFTSFAERTLPYDLVHILNRYFESVGRIADEHGGYIDKYLGDGIMVVFGLDDTSRDNPSLHAVRAAIGMLGNLSPFNAYLRERFDHEFRIGVGICTGPAVVGSLGYHRKKEFTAIGDTVNTASRIEALTKAVDRPLLVCENTYRATQDAFAWALAFRERVKGKSMELTVHALEEA
ncbi:MAG: adenylate/guanylate cyclase domain-containing protein [Pseudomonadota bacterium]